jgi:hypothetical protein
MSTHRFGGTLRAALGLATVLLTAAAPAAATVNVSAACSGDVVTIHVGVCNTYPDEMTGFVVTRQAIGTCDPVETLTPVPVELPPPGDPYLATDWIGHDFEFAAPYADVHYRYGVLFTDATGAARSYGNGFFPLGDCQPRAGFTLACTEAVIMRGLVIPMSWSGEVVSIMLIPCAEGCWGEAPQFFNVPADNPLAAVSPSGFVDIYGTQSQGNCFPYDLTPYHVTRTEPVPGGACGPLPEEATSFGSLKAMYRCGLINRLAAHARGSRPCPPIPFAGAPPFWPWPCCWSPSPAQPPPCPGSRRTPVPRSLIPTAPWSSAMEDHPPISIGAGARLARRGSARPSSSGSTTTATSCTCPAASVHRPCPTPMSRPTMLP